MVVIESSLICDRNFSHVCDSSDSWFRNLVQLPLSLVPTSDIRIIGIIIILNINISFLCSSENVRAKNVKKASRHLEMYRPKVLDLDFHWPKIQ